MELNLCNKNLACRCYN